MGRHWGLSGLLTLICLAGCGGAGDAVERVVVSGMVTKAGGLVKKGRITLYPVKGTEGPTSGGEIQEGKFRIDAKGGVPVGTHRVEIHQFEIKQQIPGRPPALDIEVNLLPEQFNKKSTVELIVESGNKNLEQDYNLDSDFGPVAK